jgi:hypothetical protein
MKKILILMSALIICSLSKGMHKSPKISQLSHGPEIIIPGSTVPSLDALYFALLAQGIVPVPYLDRVYEVVKSNNPSQSLTITTLPEPLHIPESLRRKSASASSSLPSSSSSNSYQENDHLPPLLSDEEVLEAFEEHQRYLTQQK